MVFDGGDLFNRRTSIIFGECFYCNGGFVVLDALADEAWRRAHSVAAPEKQCRLLRMLPLGAEVGRANGDSRGGP